MKLVPCALAAAAATTAAPPVAASPADPVTVARPAVLGVAHPGGHRGRLAEYDPVTLRPRGRAVTVSGSLWCWDRSPDGAAVAIGASNRGRLHVVGSRPLALRRTIELRVREPVRHVRWAQPDRLIAIVGFERPRVLEIDPGSGKVLAHRRLQGPDVAVEPTDRGLAVLLGPPSGPGAARLALLEPGAPPRLIDLPGVRAGVGPHRADVHPGDPPDLLPGLAVDPTAGVAYVAPPGPPAIVRVDLASGASEARSLRAAAAKGGAARTRSLRRLGAGRLALSGYDIRRSGRPVPAGLRIVDIRTWRARIVDARAHHASASEEGIVVPRYERRRGRPPQAVFYDTEGRRLATFRPRYGLSDIRVAGRYAYVVNGARRARNHRTHVLDRRTGRRVHTLRFTSLPHLLARP